MKKLIIGVLVVLGLFFGICLCLGYTIPQRDKHKDWSLFPENIDPNFEIEKTNIEINPFLLHFPELKGSLILNQDKDEYYHPIIIDKQYKVIKALPKAKSFFLDSLNHRIILQEIGLNKEEKFFSYDLKNFEKSKPLIVQKYPLKETFREFVIRKGYTYIRSESKHNEEWTEEYMKEKSKEIDFYKKLSAVTKLSNKYEKLDIYCYTDDKGQLYDVEETENSIDSIHEMWESLYLLFPNYNKETTGLLSQAYIHPTEADKPSVYSNFFHVGPWFSGIEFRQWHINYYTIKFGNKSFNYREKENDKISFEQLNIPKSETDTLYMLCNKVVYRVYLKNNKN